MSNKRVEFVIKTCYMENPQELQDLLNDMSRDGWDLYSMQEDEDEEGRLMCHCIFSKSVDSGEFESDIIEISSFKNRMEKLLSPELSPYEVCIDVQSKIREQKNNISKVKKALEGESPASVSRKRLNDKISAGIKELDDLKQRLAKVTSPDTMYSRLHEEKLAIHLSEELLSYLDSESELSDEELIAETIKSRLDLADKKGYVIPKIIFRDDTKLNPYEFSIIIRGAQVYKSVVYPNYLMFYEDELHLDKKIKNSISGVDGLSGRKVIWIERDKTKDFWCKGISGSEYIAKALEYFSVKYVHELFDYEELEKYIDIVKEENEFLIDNILPEVITMSDLKILLVNLIKEGVSIKDIVYIFEKINDFAHSSDNNADLLEKVRLSLSRQITTSYSTVDGTLTVFELSEASIMKFLPFAFSDDFQDDDELADTDSFSVDYEVLEQTVKKIKKYTKKFDINIPVLIVPIDLRPLISSLMNKYIDSVVLAREEIAPNFNLQIIETI